jgi:hypothetical protein
MGIESVLHTAGNGTFPKPDHLVYLPTTRIRFVLHMISMALTATQYGLVNTLSRMYRSNIGRWQF